MKIILDSFTVQCNTNVNVQHSVYRRLDFREVKAPRISRKSAHEGGKFVSRTYRPPLPPGGMLSAHF
jgi:hypothetical protein